MGDGEHSRFFHHRSDQMTNYTEADRLAAEFVSDPMAFNAVCVQLEIDGKPQLAETLREAVRISRAYIALRRERGEATRSWIPFTPDWKPPEEDVLFVTSTGMWFGWRDEAGNWFASFDDQIVCCDKDVMHWMAAPPLPICGTSPQEEK